MEPDWSNRLLLFDAITLPTVSMRLMNGKDPGIEIDGKTYPFSVTKDAPEGGPFPTSRTTASFIRDVSKIGEPPILVDFNLKWTGARPEFVGARLVTNKKPPYYKKQGEFWVPVEP